MENGLPRQHSELTSAKDGGYIGAVKRDEISTKMYNSISRLKPGEISTIIETSDTFQILKLIAAGEGQTIAIVPYETAEDEIHQKLFKGEIDSAFEQWLKSLQKKSFIKILLDD